MICPNCGHDNLPGAEECGGCLQDLTQLDRPVAHDRTERSLMEDPLTVLHPRRPILIRPTATVREAVQVMLDHDIGALLVVEGQHLLGIVSERDFLTRAALIDNYADLPVSQFMTAKLESVTVNDTLAFALHKMDLGGYRHLPVLRDGKPVGMISVRDLLHHIVRLCHDM